MASVWIVSTGDYSAYWVQCACPSEEVALEVKARWDAVNGDYDLAEIRELPFVTEATAPIEWITHRIGAVWRDGKYDFDVLDEDTRSDVGFAWEDKSAEHFYRYDYGGRVVSVTAVRPDPNEAEKIAREMWAKAEAERLGL